MKPSSSKYPWSLCSLLSIFNPSLEEDTEREDIISWHNYLFPKSQTLARWNICLTVERKINCQEENTIICCHRHRLSCELKALLDYNMMANVKLAEFHYRDFRYAYIKMLISSEYANQGESAYDTVYRSRIALPICIFLCYWTSNPWCTAVSPKLLYGRLLLLIHTVLTIGWGELLKYCAGTLMSNCYPAVVTRKPCFILTL